MGSVVKQVTVSNPKPGEEYQWLDVDSWEYGTESKNATSNNTFSRYNFYTESGEDVHVLETWDKDPGNPEYSGYPDSNENGATLLQREKMVFTSGSPGDNAYVRMRTLEEASYSNSEGWGALQVVSRKQETYTDVDGLSRLSSLKVMSSETGTDGLETTYTYYGESAGDDIHGMMKSKFNPDGSWKVWLIADEGTNQTIQEVTPHGNDEFALTSIEANPESYRLKTTTIMSGVEKSVVETVEGQTVSHMEEKFLTGDDGERICWTKRFYNSSDFLSSFKAYNAYGDGTAVDSGRIAWEIHEDGTATVYSYESDSSGGTIVTKTTGSTTGAGAAATAVTAAPTITDGVQMVTNYNSYWQEWSSATYNYKNSQVGVALESWESLPTDWDDYGRPWKKTWTKGGVAMGSEEIEYNCCGLSRHVALDGTETEYDRDELKRVYKVTETMEGGTSIVTKTDHDGLSTTVTRDGLFVSESTRSLDGTTTTTTYPSRMSGDEDDRLTKRRDRDVPNRSTTESWLSDTDTWTELSVTTRYKDGNVISVSGDAVVDRKYYYRTHSTNGGGMYTFSGISGLSRGFTQTTYTDLLGRKYRDFSYATGNTYYDYYPASASAGSRGKLKSVTDGDGVVTSYEYNSKGERIITSRKIPVGVDNALTDLDESVTTDVISSVIIHGVDLGVSRKTVRKRGAVTVSTSYRSFDGLKTATESLNGDTLTVTTLPDENGVVTTTTTHPDGTKTVTTVTDGFTTRVEKRDNTGSVVSYVEYTPDAYRRVASVKDSRTGTTTYADFTESGRALKVTQGGRETKYVCDEFGRVVETQLPDHTASEPSISYTSYYPDGKVAGQWGSQSYPTFRIYNERGDIVALRTFRSLADGTEPTEFTTGYDETKWGYSVSGLVNGKTFPDGDDEDTDPEPGPKYTYTSAGRLKTRTWANGVVTTYGYEAGMKVSNTYSGEDNGHTTPDLTFIYDANGMLDQVKRDDVLHADYDYSATDFTLTSEALNQDTTAAKTINRYYDSLLRPRSYKVGSDYTTAYGYGSGGRMTDVWDNPLLDSTGDPVDSEDDALVTGDFTYGYATSSATLIGTITGPVHKVANTWETTRDVLDSRENKDTISDPDVVVSYFDYTVNSIGQSVGLATAGSVFSTAPQWDWDYNARGELVEADDLTTASINDRAYVYDSIGNREMTVNGLLDDLPDSDNWAANALNQYDSVPTPSGGSLSPVYDDDGNMTSGPLPVDQTANATLVWDAENRLVEVTTAGGTVIAYDYDYLSRRISSTVTPAGGAATTTYYLYDGWNLIAEYSGTTLTKSYTWGMDLSGSMQGAGGVGGLLAVRIPAGVTNAGTYYPTYDGNGNVSEYLDSTGSVAAHYEYDPFGNEITPTTAQGLKQSEFSHRFSTKPLDEETGLYYYGYRYYGPVTGRWPSRDPIWEEGGLNLYGFVENDGVNGMDYLGMMPGGISPFTCNNHPSNSVPDTTRVRASELGLSIFSDEDKKKVKKKAESLGVCEMEVGEIVDSGDIKVLAIATKMDLEIGHLGAVISGEYTKLEGGWAFDGVMDPEDEQVFNFGPKDHHPLHLNVCLFFLQALNPIFDRNKFVIIGDIPWPESGLCCSDEDKSEN